MPSLERCDTISGSSVVVGFAFLTLAIITGLLWSHHARGRYWTLGRQGVERPHGLDHLRRPPGHALAHGLGRAARGAAGHRRASRRSPSPFVWTTVLSGAPVRRATRSLDARAAHRRRQPPHGARSRCARRWPSPRTPRRGAAAPARGGGRASEAMILSTCNRVEVYARGDGARTRRSALRRSWRVPRHGRRRRSRPASTGSRGEEAVRHAFRVAASLDSMVIGEPQILGQVKEAYQAAEAAGTLGPLAERAAQPLAGRGQARAHRDGHRRATPCRSPTWPWSWRGRSSASSTDATCCWWARAR